MAWALEGLEVAGPKLDILWDICKGVKQPKEEPITKVVQQLRKLATHSVQSAKWSERDSLLYFRGHIYVPPTSDLCQCIIFLCHDTKVAGHAG